MLMRATVRCFTTTMFVMFKAKKSIRMMQALQTDHVLQLLFQIKLLRENANVIYICIYCIKYSQAKYDAITLTINLYSPIEKRENSYNNPFGMDNRIQCFSCKKGKMSLAGKNSYRQKAKTFSFLLSSVDDFVSTER